jgi:hypothetical protein
LTRTLVVFEVKTEIRDVGAIERALNWYLREAGHAASRFGWRPAVSVSVLVVLATDANDRTVSANRRALEVAFPSRATALRDLIGSGMARGATRYLAAIDPRSRRRQWLMATSADGRRSPAPYVDYIDAARILESGRVR